jgi:uncharacterized protein with FMN-binding domain
MMRVSVTVLLVLGFLPVSTCLDFMGLPQASAQEVYPAPVNDFQRGRALIKEGDAKRLQKDFAGARKCYEEAQAIFQSNNNRLFANASQEMIDLCAAMPLNMSRLKNGTYEGTERGYVADVTVSVELKGGRIRQFQIVSQRENRPLKALQVVPRLIVDRQTPSVDAVTGATITSCAVMSATLKAIQKALPDAPPPKVTDPK